MPAQEELSPDQLRRELAEEREARNAGHGAHLSWSAATADSTSGGARGGDASASDPGDRSQCSLGAELEAMMPGNNALRLGELVGRGVWEGGSSSNGACVNNSGSDWSEDDEDTSSGGEESESDNDGLGALHVSAESGFRRRAISEGPPSRVPTSDRHSLSRCSHESTHQPSEKQKQKQKQQPLSDGPYSVARRQQQLYGGERVFQLFIQMQLCHGTLADWLKGRASIDRARNMRLFEQIMQGLEHVHSRSLIHRDIKVSRHDTMLF